MLVEAFFPMVLPDVIGCPDPMLQQQIVLAAHHFCTETGVWDEIQDPIKLQAGVTEYEIDAPSKEAYVARVTGVWLNNLKLEPEQMKKPRVEGVKPTGYHAARARGAITLNGSPLAGDILVVRAVYAPSLQSKNLPDFLMERYADAIASGAKHRLMAMPGKDWSNPAIAQFYGNQYDNALADARIEMERGSVPGSLRVKPRPFF